MLINQYGAVLSYHLREAYQFAKDKSINNMTSSYVSKYTVRQYDSEYRKKSASIDINASQLTFSTVDFVKSNELSLPNSLRNSNKLMIESNEELILIK